MPLPADAVVPVNAGPVTLNTVPIDLRAGFQYDPHVSGDVVSYTDQAAPDVSAVRYYLFSSNVGGVIPATPGVVDSLSDSSGSRIAFTRVSVAGSGVFVFDTATLAAPVEVDPQTGVNRVGVAIGNATVAYVDFVFNGVNLIGTLALYDLNAQTSFRATLPGTSSQNPSVSPSGDMVVFEKCLDTNVSYCDIQKIQRIAGVWNTSAVTNTVGVNPVATENNPDTDGTTIVYESNRDGTSGGNDIYFVPVAGGAEQRIELPGDQFNPSIANGVIGFESNVTGAQRDLYVYIIATNQLIQVTSSPATDEFLNDLTVLPSGDIRIAWSVNKALPANDTGDIYAATFTPPPPPPPVCKIRVDDLVKRSGSAVTPFTGTDNGQNGTYLRLTSMGRIRTALGADVATVWRLRNSGSKSRITTLFGVGTSYSSTWKLPARTETFVASKVVRGPAVHALFEGKLPIDLKAASEASYSDGRETDDPKCP
jgi:hypothetical protein